MASRLPFDDGTSAQCARVCTSSHCAAAADSYFQSGVGSSDRRTDGVSVAWTEVVVTFIIILLLWRQLSPGVRRKFDLVHCTLAAQCEQEKEPGTRAAAIRGL